ncbi:hypothetical protein MTO96_007725 [Rhipicephalus appendiculatus]
MCGTNMIRCALYRRQIDACRTCGKLGHSSDVCPSPTAITCPDCGVSSPSENHICQPKCSICGEAHPRADRACETCIRSPTSFGVEGDDAEKLTSSVGSSCHSKLPGLGSAMEVNLIHIGGVRATALARKIGLPPVSGLSRNLPGLNEWAKNVSLALSSSASCHSKLRLEYSS